MTTKVKDLSIDIKYIQSSRKNKTKRKRKRKTKTNKYNNCIMNKNNRHKIIKVLLTHFSGGSY